MVIRCKNCQETIWVQPADERSATVLCTHCSQEYRLQGWTKLSSAERRLSEDARKLARKEGIDLPGAYSVVLGIMTVDEVQELGSGGSTSCRTSSSSRPRFAAQGAADLAADLSKESDRKYRYDPAFKDAVEGGFLTSRQALERGKRDTYAAMVSSRHRLPIEAAYEVADNRVSLLEAMRRRRKRPTKAVPVSVSTGAVRRHAMRAGVALIVVALAVAIYGKTTDKRRGEDEVLAGAGEAEVTADDAGRIVQIAGPTPGSVLTGFCRSAIPGKSLEAIDLVASGLPGPRARLGLLRDPSRPDAVLAITIREDREAGRWVAGDGTVPLVASLAPQNAQRAMGSR